MKSEPREYCANGILLKCHHCGHELFTAELIALRIPSNVRLLDILDIGTLDLAVESLVCAKCGFVHQFSRGFVTPRSALSNPAPCLACGEIIPAGASACPKCGWSYEAKEPRPPAP
jgi:rubredoxin